MDKTCINNIMMSDLALVKCDGYKNIKKAIQKSLDLLGGLNKYVKQKDKVLIKPNICTCRTPEKAAVTHPLLIRAVIELVKEITPYVYVGEQTASTLSGSPKEAIEKTGIKKIIQDTNSSFRDFQYEGFVEKYIKDSVVLNKTGFAEAYFDADVIINLPKLKSHSITYLTGAIKNCIGFLSPEGRKCLDSLIKDITDFNQAIVDVFSFIRPKIKLNIMDAVVAMEGEGGPTTGLPVKIGYIITSEDAVAIDTVASKLTGHTPSKILTSRYAALRGFGTNDFRKIKIYGQRLQAIDSFKKHSSYKKMLNKTTESFELWITEKCKLCGACIKSCPADAIKKSHGKYIINKKKCIQCLCCLEVCSIGAIQQIHLKENTLSEEQGINENSLQDTYTEPALIKCGSICNNNCTFCTDFGDKELFDKSYEDIRKEIVDLKKKGISEIIFPCNADIRKDFVDILAFAKGQGFNISLYTNGRMFCYRQFCEKTADFVDNFYFVLFTAVNNKINDFMTDTENTLSQSITGLKNIVSLGKEVSIILPLTIINAETLLETIYSLPDVEKIEVKVVHPHPGIYKELVKIDKNKNISIIDKPYEIKFEITSRCNLKCNFCYNKNSFSRNLPDLPKKKIFDIIDKIASSGVRNIRFTGGEPFLRKDLYEILKYAKSKSLYTLVNTNGTLINDFSALRGIVDYMLLPFHSLNQDEVSFKKKLITSLNKNNIPFRLNTVLIKDNIYQLEKYFRLIGEMEVEWFLARPVPTADNKMPIDNDDVRILIEKLLLLTKRYDEIFVDGIPFCAYEPEKVKLFSKGATICGIFDKLVIDPSGNIKPCYSINEEIGRILNDPLEKAWTCGLSADIRKLKVFPDRCKECKYLNGCLGGCRFAAKLVNGRYDAMDPLAKPGIFLS
ncbi:DUF362 domain-containing protein [Candidatus Woesearchaeota archaeon]|nr:DUF362 domain-containing protein [Candidatus Woesearchaeota archaeon]